jgi:hypothetical protein
VRLYKDYEAAEKNVKFCEKYYLDNQTMGELANIKEQLGQITGDIGVPNTGGGPVDDYLCAIAKGLIQFVCIRNTKGSYRSLTAEKIEIHPGSVMYRETPKYIVAGEIVRTTKMYARSVSALKKEWIARISPELSHNLHLDEGERAAGRGEATDARAGRQGAKGKTALATARASAQALPGGRPATAGQPASGAAAGQAAQAVDTSWQVSIAGRIFQLEKYKGKKKLLRLSWEDVQFLLGAPAAKNLPESHANLRTVVAITSGPLRGELLHDEKLSRVLATARWIEYPAPKPAASLGKAKLGIWDNLPRLTDTMPHILQLAPAKKDKDLGFITLYTNQEGMFWFKPTLGFSTALAESLASLEYIADSIDAIGHPQEAAQIGALYRRLTQILESV